MVGRDERLAPLLRAAKVDKGRGSTASHIGSKPASRCNTVHFGLLTAFLRTLMALLMLMGRRCVSVRWSRDAKVNGIGFRGLIETVTLPQSQSWKGFSGCFRWI
jgi:hypothetical protein